MPAEIQPLEAFCVMLTLIMVLFLEKTHDAYARKRRIACVLSRLPGLTGLPFLGNLLEQGKHIDDHYYWKLGLFNTFGQTYAMKVDIMLDGSVCTSSAANVKHILYTNHANYIKPAMMQRALSELMGNGIFTVNSGPDTQTWHYQRKAIASLFSTNAFKQLLDTVFLRHTADLVAQLSATTGTMVNIENIMLALTTKFTYAMAFGMEFKSDTHDFHELFREASNLSVARFTRPWYQWLAWFMPSEYRMARVMGRIDALCYSIIQEKREQLADENDLLSVLLRKQKRENNISDTFIRDMMMTMMLAGRETVASALMWVIYCLSKHPAVEAELMTEIRRFGPHLVFENIGQMKYLDAVIHETFRLFPPVPYELKCAVDDDLLPDGTVVPAGTNVEFSPFVMGRDESSWPDAKLFSPNRWLGKTKTELPTAYQNPVFNAGVRACVGQVVAILQLKAVICTLYQNFHFELVAPLGEPSFVLGIGLFANGGIHVIPHRCST
jgi:cytochrome P450